MKISELIAQLHAMQVDHGDIQVRLQGGESNEWVEVQHDHDVDEVILR